MKLKRLLSVLDVCECTADPELDIRDISFDSRTTQPGDLFAAVCGYESDGHQMCIRDRLRMMPISPSCMSSAVPP